MKSLLRLLSVLGEISNHWFCDVGAFRRSFSQDLIVLKQKKILSLRIEIRLFDPYSISGLFLGEGNLKSRRTLSNPRLASFLYTMNH